MVSTASNSLNLRLKHWSLQPLEELGENHVECWNLKFLLEFLRISTKGEDKDQMQEVDCHHWYFSDPTLSKQRRN